MKYFKSCIKREWNRIEIAKKNYRIFMGKVADFCHMKTAFYKADCVANHFNIADTQQRYHDVKCDEELSIHKENKRNIVKSIIVHYDNHYAGEPVRDLLASLKKKIEIHPGKKIILAPECFSIRESFFSFRCKALLFGATYALQRTNYAH